MKNFLVIVLGCVITFVLLGCPPSTGDSNGNNGGGTTAPTYEKPEDVTSPTIGTLKGIKGGSFLLGEGVEADPINTSVDSFLLADTEVTQGQWEEVMVAVYGEENDLWPGDKDEKPNYAGIGVDKPAYFVSWCDALEFCNALSEKESLSKVYTITKVDATRQNTWTVEVNQSATGYRLPTVAEWEYAAGGGDVQERTIYAAPITVDENSDGIDDNDPSKNLQDYAWYFFDDFSLYKNVGTAGSSEDNPSVKSGNSNALGLYDMSGHVSEWCYDLTPTISRAIRGGDIADKDENNLLVAKSNGSGQDARIQTVGFRVARSVK